MTSQCRLFSPNTSQRKVRSSWLSTCGCSWAGRATNSSYRPVLLPEPVDRAGVMLRPAGCCQLTPLEGGQDANPCNHSRADYRGLCVPVHYGHGRSTVSGVCRPGGSTEAATVATAKDNQQPAGSALPRQAQNSRAQHLLFSIFLILVGGLKHFYVYYSHCSSIVVSMDFLS